MNKHKDYELVLKSAQRTITHRISLRFMYFFVKKVKISRKI